MNWQEWDEEKWGAIPVYDRETRWSGESWAKAFIILGKYGNKGMINLEAAHDQIWVGPAGRNITPMSDEDAIEMHKLGFTWDDYCDSWRRYT